MGEDSATFNDTSFALPYEANENGHVARGTWPKPVSELRQRLSHGVSTGLDAAAYRVQSPGQKFSPLKASRNNNVRRAALINWNGVRQTRPHGRGDVDLTKDD